MHAPLRVLVVEDEALLVMQLETFLNEAGHLLVGDAMSSREAFEIAPKLGADLALVDIHLADGPTGIEVGRFIVANTDAAVVYVTANPKRLADDLSGAIGVIAKPYSKEGLTAALDYLFQVVRCPPPRMPPPRSLALAPNQQQPSASP